MLPVSYCNINTIIPSNDKNDPNASNGQYTQFVDISNLPNLNWYISRINISFNTRGIKNVWTPEIAIINNINTTIQPGFYDIPSLVSLFKLNIPQSGPYAFYAQATIPIVLELQIAKILGFQPNTYITPGTISNTIIDEYVGFDLLSLSCSLVTDSQYNLIDTISITRNIDNISKFFICKIPITPSTLIVWKYKNKNNESYILNSDIIITLFLEGY